MKHILIKRIAELAMAIAQHTQDLNMMRGQKSEAEAMLTHMVNEENKAAADAAAVATAQEQSTPSAES